LVAIAPVLRIRTLHAASRMRYGGRRGRIRRNRKNSYRKVRLRSPVNHGISTSVPLEQVSPDFAVARGIGVDDALNDAVPAIDPAKPFSLISFGHRLAGAYDLLTDGLLERSVEAKLLLLAAICGEHLFLVGPPGTAKSLLARRLALVCKGQFFERLLTRFSVPEDMFGPLSLKALEADKLQRKCEGFLPDADVAFLDEVFKANSSILNALLTLLNERMFHNGKELLHVPLWCTVAASNELPGDDAIDALYDRFLFRRKVKCVSDGEVPGFLRAALNETSPAFDGARTDELVRTKADTQGAGALLTVADCVELRAEAAACVDFPERLLRLLVDLRRYLRDDVKPPVLISDRRLGRAVQLLRVVALSAGFRYVSELDLLLLQHVFWDKEPEHAEIIRDWLFEHCYKRV
jgi:MoxR-like ATPase